MAKNILTNTKVPETPRAKYDVNPDWDQAGFDSAIEPLVHAIRDFEKVQW